MERSRNEQGMALLAVVAVLVALVLIATPFALQMQSAADRSQDLLYSEQADQEARQLFTLVGLYSLNGVEEIEREAAGDLDPEEEDVPLFATPDYDVPGEIGLPAEELARFNSNSARGRIWDVRLEDEQAKFNLNSAPYQVLGNLFGGSVLSRELEEDDDEILLADTSMLPEKDGVIRIGTEMIYYEELDNGRLRGVERGYQSDKPWNSGPQTWKAGEMVMLASAFEMATLPIRIDEKGYRPYRNVFEAKRIVELGTTAIDPDNFDRLSEYLTCWSGREVAGGWCNSQVVRNSLPSGSSGDEGDYLVLDDPTYYGPGTIVRISSGENVEYGVVLKNNGRQITLGSSIQNDYQVGEARVESLARHPININTASEAVLVACLANVKLRTATSGETMTVEKAMALVPRLREEPIKSLKQYKEILQDAQNAGIIAQADYNALYLNALNPGHWLLTFSTVPFSFKSWDTYTVKATAVVNSKTGEEIARKTLRRVISVSPRRSAVAGLHSQKDFEDQIIASRDAKYMMTFPGNTGGQYQGRTIPPSRYTAHITRNIWPSESREPGLGDVRLQPERLGLARVFHYDESHYADGYYIQGSALTYSTGNDNIGLADTDGTMNPVAASFWYKPFWGGVGSTQILMDTGEETWTNRVAVFYDGTTQEMVFRVADATLEDRAVEVRYEADADQILDETWYHVGISVPGTKPGDLTLLIDGQSVGDPTYLSRLSQSVSATGEVSELYVDDASSFPESGALIVRGEDGSEIFEYDGRSESSFTVTRRYAREPIALVQSDSYEGHAFADGAVVTLLGYSSPLLTDLPVGGSTLAKDLGAFHCMKVLFIEDKIYITEGTPGDDGTGPGGGLDAGGGLGTGGEPPAGVTIQDGGAGLDTGDGGGGSEGSIEVLGIASDRDSLTLKLGETLKAWDDGADDSEAFSAFGESGFALLVSPQITLGAEQSADEEIGGWEVVTYEKSGGNLNIRRYAETRQIEAADFHFVPAHTYGSEDATISVDMGGGTEATGVATALIPISIEGTGGGGVDYFDVTEDDELTVPALALQRVFCSIGTEWFAYTYPDEDTSAGKVLFVHDRPADINSVVALFGAGTVTTSAIGAGDGDLGELPVDPGDLPPDVDPPAEPPAPPPPGEEEAPPQDDDGGPDGSTPPPVDGAPPEDDDGGPSDTTPPLPDDGPPPTDDDSGPSGNPSPFPDDDPGAPPSDDDGGPSGTPPDPDSGIPGGDDDGGPGSGGGGSAPPDEPPGGDDGSGDEPPSEDQGADIGASNSIGETEVPWPEEEIARRLNHRARSEFTVADTFEQESAAQGDEIRPAFMAAAYRGERPGFDDRFSVVLPGEGPKEELRVRHSFAEDSVKTWISLTSFAGVRYDHSDGSVNSIVQESVELKDVARILKFPSGELPDAVGDLIRFGSRFDGSGVSSAVLDELYFKNDVNDEIYRLGDGAALVEDDTNEFVTYEGSRFADLDANATSVFIHMRPTSSNPDGLPVTGLEEDGGVLRLADELIVYRELDTATGELKRCERGVLNTESGVHAFDSPVTEMEQATIAVLDGGISGSSFELPLNRKDGFPLIGYVRVDDEVIGYTRIQGNSLVMPQDVTDEELGWGESAGDADLGVGIFRARYGTIASDHGDDAIVYLLPSRYPDRYRSHSLHPDTSALVIRKRMDGAIWKRLSWDERISDNMDVKVCVRFDGTPEWDSDNIYNVSEGMVSSGNSGDFQNDPKSFLFVVENAHDLNRFRVDGGIQADLVEVRITYQYGAGAFDPYAQPPANSWKDTPWLKALRLEYLAPVTVHYSEDIR